MICLWCTHLQKWWSPAGFHWWRPVSWSGFWCRPSRSSPPWHRSPPLWHRRCLAPLAPSWRSCKGCQCPRPGFQTASRTGGTSSTLVKRLRHQSFRSVTPGGGSAMRTACFECQLRRVHTKQNTSSCRSWHPTASRQYKKEHEKKVASLTETGLFVGRQLHKVWTGAGRSAVVIDEAQMWAGTTSIIVSTRVGGWWEGIRTHQNTGYEKRIKEIGDRISTGCEVPCRGDNCLIWNRQEKNWKLRWRT